MHIFRSVALIIAGCSFLLVPPVYDSIARGHHAEVQSGGHRSSLPNPALGHAETLFFYAVGVLALGAGLLVSAEGRSLRILKQVTSEEDAA